MTFFMTTFSSPFVRPDGAKRVEGYEHKLAVRFPRIGQRPPSGRTAIVIFILLLSALPTSAMSPMGFGQKPKFDEKENKKKPRKNPLAEKPMAELKIGLEQALKAKDFPTALKYLDAMRIVCTDHEQIKEILIQMADLYYQQEEWTKSERAYNEFILLYPGAARCDYAHYKAVECGFKLTSEPDRDQTKTQEVLALADQFIADHSKSEFLPAVTKLATDCREKLLASDTNVFNFYLKNNNFKAAQKRIDIISKEHAPKLPDAQPQVLEMTIQLAQAQNDQVKLWEAQLQLVDQFPYSDVTKRLALAPEVVRADYEKNMASKLAANAATPAPQDSKKPTFSAKDSVTITQATQKKSTTA